MGVNTSCIKKKPPERKSLIPLLPINKEIFKQLTPEYYFEISIDNVEEFELDEFKPIRIICPTMSQAVDNIPLIINRYHQRFGVCDDMMIIIHFVVPENLDGSIEIPLSYKDTFIFHFESSYDHSSLIYWKLRTEEATFNTLIHPNRVQLGAFIVNDILAYNLSFELNGLQESVVIKQGNVQIIHPLMLTKNPDYYPDLITYALGTDNNDIANFLSELDHIDNEINEWTQIDYAYEGNFLNHVLFLLQLNSQFPENFEESINNSSENLPSELKEFIQSSQRFHDSISDSKPNHNFIERHAAQNPGLKYFYNLKNQSAMARAIEIGNFDIVQNFTNKRIGLGPHESLEKLKKNLSPLIEPKVAGIHDDFFQPHIMTLTLNCHLGFNSTQNISLMEVIFETFKQLNTIDEVRILLRSVAAIKYSKVFFDCSSRKSQIDYCKNTELLKMGRIYIQADDLIDTKNIQLLNGRIAHAFCHYVMLELYDNDCKPFREQKEEWNDIMTRYPTKERKDHIFTEVFNNVEENYRDAELIARYAEIHARHSSDGKSSNTIRDVYRSLRNYYEQCTYEMEKEILSNQKWSLRIKKYFRRYQKIILGSLLLVLGVIFFGVLIAGKLTNTPENDNCGRTFVGTSLSYGATLSEKGQWPWFASLYDRSNSNRFFCGSTIISKKHLLTAAHCVEPKKLPPRVASEIFTFIGRYDINDDNETHSVKMNITKIFIHDAWFTSKQSINYNGDIAILLVEYEINFNNYVQPICLPDSKMKVKKIGGFVAGYGLNESEQIVDKIKYIAIPTVEDCVFEDGFKDILSRTMFCAGEKGKVPCKGDSGGGFFHLKRNSRWEILGIVSAAPNLKCDGNNSTAFTNVVDHLKWIYETLNNSGNETQIILNNSTDHESNMTQIT